MCHSIFTRTHEPAMMLMAMIPIQHHAMMQPMKISQSVSIVIQSHFYNFLKYILKFSDTDKHELFHFFVTALDMGQDVLVWWLLLQTIPSALSELPTMQKLVVSYQKCLYMFVYKCLYGYIWYITI